MTQDEQDKGLESKGFTVFNNTPTPKEAREFPPTTWKEPLIARIEALEKEVATLTKAIRVIVQGQTLVDKDRNVIITFKDE